MKDAMYIGLFGLRDANPCREHSGIDNWYVVGVPHRSASPTNRWLNQIATEGSPKYAIERNQLREYPRIARGHNL